MIYISESEDVDLIAGIMCRPDIYPWISDDGSPDAEYFDPSPVIGLPTTRFLVPNNGAVMGVFFYQQNNSITWEVHTCLLPEYRGKIGREAAILSLHWMMSNTGCHKVITHIPTFNRHAKTFALSCGLVLEGVSRSSYMKDNRAFDQWLLGICKGEIPCPQQQR